MLKKFSLGFLALVVVVNIAIAAIAITTSRDRDLSIPEAAVAFERAVIGGNYEAVWEIGSEEYREGLTREQFIERARETASPADTLFDWTVLNETFEDRARAHTRIQLSSGDIQTHRIILDRVNGEWRVSEYRDYSGPWPPDEPPLAGS